MFPGGSALVKKLFQISWQLLSFGYFRPFINLYLLVDGIEV